MSQTITKTVEKYDDNSVKITTTITDVSEIIYSKEQLLSLKESSEQNVINVQKGVDEWTGVISKVEELGVKSQAEIRLEEEKLNEEKLNEEI